ncbi:MAG: hypothetical protein ABIQ70_14250 [Dokdonella sp.]
MREALVRTRIGDDNSQHLDCRFALVQAVASMGEPYMAHATGAQRMLQFPVADALTGTFTVRIRCAVTDRGILNRAGRQEMLAIGFAVGVDELLQPNVDLGIVGASAIQQAFARCAVQLQPLREEPIRILRCTHRIACVVQ